VQLFVEVKIYQVKREHILVAQLGRRKVHTAIWLRQYPTCSIKLVEHDCNITFLAN
jgi:hypothetical protein